MKVEMIKGSLLAFGGLAAAGVASLAVTPFHVSLSDATPRVSGHKAHPVLVELFQSQGCSDCPPANANLNALADRPDVVALSFGVTYWDYLGWKDTFATPENTERQWDYAHRNGRENVATPQVWINGRTAVVGSDAHQLAQAIAAASVNGPALGLNGDEVHVGGAKAPRGGADLWVARYDPRVVQVPIRAGENGGRTLPHRNVVRQLAIVGHWSGPPVTFKLSPGERNLSVAVFLQQGKGGPILAAAKSR
jgi:hypothetical protein